MKRVQFVQYILSLFSLLIFGCSQDETTSEETILEVTEELVLATLNASDLEILENCSELSADIESINCCIVFPDSVVVNEMYFGGSRYVKSDGNGLVHEPEGSTYKWKLTGDGIKISEDSEQFIILEFDESFEGASIETTVFASDGSRCIAKDSIHLKE